jgi:hypothetical protein
MIGSTVSRSQSSEAFGGGISLAVKAQDIRFGKIARATRAIQVSHRGRPLRAEEILKSGTQVPGFDARFENPDRS